MGSKKSLLITLYIFLFALTTMGDPTPSPNPKPAHGGAGGGSTASPTDTAEDPFHNDYKRFLTDHFIIANDADASTFANWLEKPSKDEKGPGRAMGILSLSTAANLVDKTITELGGKTGKAYEWIKKGMERRKLWEALLKDKKEGPPPYSAGEDDKAFETQFDSYFKPKLKKNECFEKLMAETSGATTKEAFMESSKKLYEGGGEGGCKFTREEVQAYADFYANKERRESEISFKDAAGTDVKRKLGDLAGDGMKALSVPDEKGNYFVNYANGKVWLGNQSEKPEILQGRAKRTALIRFDAPTDIKNKTGNLVTDKPQDGMAARDTLLARELSTAGTYEYLKPGQVLNEGTTKNCNTCHNSKEPLATKDNRFITWEDQKFKKGLTTKTPISGDLPHVGADVDTIDADYRALSRWFGDINITKK